MSADVDAAWRTFGRAVQKAVDAGAQDMLELAFDDHRPRIEAAIRAESDGTEATRNAYRNGVIDGRAESEAKVAALDVERLALSLHPWVTAAWSRSGVHAHAWCEDMARIIAAEYARLATEGSEG